MANPDCRDCKGTGKVIGDGYAAVCDCHISTVLESVRPLLKEIYESAKARHASARGINAVIEENKRYRSFVKSLPECICSAYDIARGLLNNDAPPHNDECRKLTELRREFGIHA